MVARPQKRSNLRRHVAAPPAGVHHVVRRVLPHPSACARAFSAALGGVAPVARCLQVGGAVVITVSDVVHL